MSVKGLKAVGIFIFLFSYFATTVMLLLGGAGALGAIMAIAPIVCAVYWEHK